MKTVKSNNLRMAFCAAVVLFLSTSVVFSQPPDNAALLYYQAFLLYEKPDATMDKMLSDFLDDKIMSNEVIEQYIEKNRKVLKLLITAADTPNCDWGYDYSQGFELMMPNLAQLRQATYLIQTEAKLLAEQGDYSTALERCLSMHKTALHAADRTLVSYLVAIAISALANGSIQDILADMPGDLEVLNRLKGQLNHINNKFPPLRDCIVYEGEMCAETMRKEKAQALVEMASGEEGGLSTDAVELILSADEEFFKRNRDYWYRSIAALEATLELGLPYPQTYVELGELVKKTEREADENPDATLTAMSLPAVNKIYSLAVRRKTHLNAVIAAIDIYIIKAKAGRLPDTLPAGLPKDLFSDKDFEYEKTDAGFVLRCQGKNLARNEVHEYEFKVTK